MLLQSRDSVGESLIAFTLWTATFQPSGWESFLSSSPGGIACRVKAGAALKLKDLHNNCWSRKSGKAEQREKWVWCCVFSVTDQARELKTRWLYSHGLLRSAPSTGSCQVYSSCMLRAVLWSPSLKKSCLQPHLPLRAWEHTVCLNSQQSLDSQCDFVKSWAGCSCWHLGALVPNVPKDLPVPGQRHCAEELACEGPWGAGTEWHRLRWQQDGSWE